ncbi:hypothetical protein FEM33_16370 [Dyadobacter flavalbus]|uniref:TFIIB-type zinc ribbon-containing protein n=1 Tax=Dyadobacter flavalbus TaxID=2579942 RepID=A0A5M8QPX6_9BACT|nr:hypothetical protein [Dyadobacter flavalbus]KAA6438277.1 hypothetical protein FEM33_16370 [Dyadobacter flavalbus]
MDEYLVECPKCKQAAFVRTDKSYHYKDAKLTCYHCHFVEKRSERIRYQVIVKRNCDNCGNAIEEHIPNNNQKVSSILISCPHCGIVRTLQPRNEEYFIKYNSCGVSDPIFGLPLWLQCEVKGNAFWALNRRHLNEIQDYVSSTLRERLTTNYTTMVKKLPNFIKDRKNRAAILKAIGKLSVK